MTTKPDLFRLLPSIDELLRDDAMRPVAQRFGHAATLEASRSFFDGLRKQISAGSLDDTELAAGIAQAPFAIERRLSDSLSYSLRPVINATGVILHTNLGRAPIAQAAGGRPDIASA